MAPASDLDVAGRTVLVVGGSTAALGEVSGLVNRGAAVTVAAVEVAASLLDLAARGLVRWLPREAEDGDYSEAALVVAATGSAELDRAVAQVAREQNRIVVTAEPARAAGRVVPGAGRSGRVILVGGGPGDPGLLTVAGLEAIRDADVIICDRLAPLAALAHARPHATIIDVGKIPRGAFTPQDRINQLLVEHASRGQVVVRFKGGDSFVFGRGGEEWQACAAAGVAVEVIPGVTSAVAGPALAGIPLTHRQLTQGFTVVSGHLAPDDPGSTLHWPSLARANSTLVILMGVVTLPAIAAVLVRHGLSPLTPAVTIADAGLPSQRVVRGTVASIAGLARDAQIQAPAITVIGAVAAFDPRSPTESLGR